MNGASRRIRFAAAVLAMALTGMFALFSAPASAAPAAAAAPVAANDLGTLTSDVSGTFTDAAGAGTFTGTFVPSQFSTDGTNTFATGVLSGNLVSADGTSRAVSQ